MIITYYGSSCFKVQSGETVLVFDPPSKESKFKSPRFASNLVFVSHNHKDHNGWENFTAGEKKAVVLRGPGEYESGGTHIKGVLTYHDSSFGKDRGMNTAYVVNLENMNICHLGDFGEVELRGESKEDIGEVDILFVPIGGDSVIDAEMASKIVSQIEPRIVIPMHYGDSKSTEFKKFINEMGGNGKPIDKLTLKKKDLEGKEMQFIVLNAE
ncbi:MAG: MBL fold metallo-hydrolase [Parcubacteria group bacterium]|nr:MBL fold metallo-hydrolase [Parcubacteria group bacterium]MCR4343060.1 MBL fold metallo-hydrolase [Patescibacteria group bacterium]